MSDRKSTFLNRSMKLISPLIISVFNTPARKPMDSTKLRWWKRLVLILTPWIVNLLSIFPFLIRYWYAHTHLTQYTGWQMSTLSRALRQLMQMDAANLVSQQSLNQTSPVHVVALIIVSNRLVRCSLFQAKCEVSVSSKTRKRSYLWATVRVQVQSTSQSVPATAEVPPCESALKCFNNKL